MQSGGGRQRQGELADVSQRVHHQPMHPAHADRATGQRQRRLQPHAYHISVTGSFRIVVQGEDVSPPIILQYTLLLPPRTLRYTNALTFQNQGITSRLVVGYVFSPRASKADSALRHIAHCDRRMRVGTNERRICGQIVKSLTRFTCTPTSSLSMWAMRPLP